ncbi:MAG: DUF6516 family protein [Chloroflexota bacterium]|nr:DUF6516 family protein [Chloroflexota bacterium]
MDFSAIYERQLELAKKKFPDILDHGEVLHSVSGQPLKLRLNIIDGSTVDVFYSAKGKYSYHWERRIVNGSIFRHDNAPHKRWKQIKTFPKHLHRGSEDGGEESYLSDDPYRAIEEFLSFIRRKLAGKE